MDNRELITKIVLRNDSTANWSTAADTTLLKGEPGIEFLSGGKTKIKFGDGVKKWSDLPYFVSGLEVLGGEGAPSNALVGEVGQFYYDTLNKKIYVNLDAELNTWKQVVTLDELANLGAGDMLKAAYATNGIEGTVDKAQKVIDSTNGRNNRPITVDDNKTGLDDTVSNGLWTAKKISEEVNTRIGASEEKLQANINKKVNIEEGKGLSSNDYTNKEKTKLAGIEDGAEVNVQADWNESEPTSDAFIKNKPATLPADGGNADTVDGRHVDDTKTDTQNLWTSKKISDHIASNIEIANNYTDGKIADAISGITSFEIKRVDALPQPGEKGFIYLLPHTHEGNDDGYDEYIWITSTETYEKIGNTDINLSDYVKFTDLPNVTVGNAEKVNGHTVEKDVPADAKFTDTVYTLPVATGSKLGGVKSGTNVTVDGNGVLNVGKDVLLATDTFIINGGNALS